MNPFVAVCPFCKGRCSTSCPVCRGSGMVVAGTGALNGMGGLDGFNLSSIGKSISKTLKKVKKEVSRSASKVSAQLKRSKKHIVGGAAILAGAALLPVAGPTAGLALMGAGAGMATKGGRNIGKFKEWVKPVGIGAGIGATAGALYQFGPMMFASKTAAATAAKAAPVAAAGSAAESGVIVSAAPAAAAAAGEGISWGGIGTALTSGLQVAKSLFGGPGAGGAGSVMSMVTGGGAPTGGAYPGIDAAYGGQPYYTPTYEGGGQALSPGASPTSYVSEGEEPGIMSEAGEVITKAIEGKLTAKEWAIYGGSALALGFLTYAVIKRARRSRG